jgi:hypothetical protein
MRRTPKTLTAGAFALASSMLATTSPAQWGPGWGPGFAPGWGADGPPVAGREDFSYAPSGAPAVTREDWDVVPNPYGPGWTETRRRERRSGWAGPAGTHAPDWSPLGPSPTDIRRYERQLFYRGLGMPY